MFSLCIANSCFVTFLVAAKKLISYVIPRCKEETEMSDVRVCFCFVLLFAYLSVNSQIN
jgi:Kef-type K+ transport system membrane component KefB